MPDLQNPVGDILTGTDPIVEWLLPDVLPRGSLVTLAGEPGAGKSYLSYTLSLALATQQPILGATPDRPCKILYFDQENSRPDRDQYLRWAWNALGQPSLNLINQNFWTYHFTLGGRDWAMKAAEVIAIHRPDMFIFDTTTPCCAIEDENDNAQASKAIDQIRRLQCITNPTSACLILKHAKVEKDHGTYTLRGAKTWAGAVDSVIYQTKSAGHPRTDGLINTYLQPSKTRAFGLRQAWKIEPHWNLTKTGLELHFSRV